jgi:hypothetical protein
MSDAKTATNLPDVSFVATNAPVVAPGRRLRSAQSVLEVSLEDPDLLDDVLASSPLKDVEWSVLHAYMHRRFGPPTMPGDDYKDLSGSWLLTTPSPEVCVTVRPSLSGAGHTFAPMSTGSLAKFTPENVAAIKAAYRTLLVDLLRPVSARDEHFNALGKVEDDDLLLEDDEESDALRYAVDYHPSAGKVVPQGVMDGDDWRKLGGLLRHVGDGSATDGLREVISLLSRQVIEKTSEESHEFRTLLAGYLVTNEMVGTAQRMDFDIDELMAARERVRDILGGRTTFTLDLDVGEIERLQATLGALGIRSGLREAIERKAYVDAFAAGRAALYEILGDDLSPLLDYVAPSLSQPLIPEAIENARQTGRNDIADWIEQFAPDQAGVAVVMSIAAQVQREWKTKEVPVPEPTQTPATMRL